MSRSGWILVVLVLLMGAVGMHVYYRVYRVAPAPQFQSADDHFLYGSIGTEEERGVPYWIWLVLPRIFPEYLPGPGGYASLGIMAREGHEMPVGLSKVEIGVPRVGVNCAFCHTATVRATPTEAPTFYPGAPAHRIGAQEYRRFLVAAASDARFDADTILDEIARNVRLSLPDRLLYRFVLIPRTRRALLQLADEGTAARRGPRADAVPLWHLKRRDTREIVRSEAIRAGASTRWMTIDREMWDRPGAKQPSSLRRVLEYISGLQPPKYPFSVDASLAGAGAKIYAATCAACHDARDGREPGPPLDGVWLTAPYLHNGSVPTLRDLLEPPANRPARFWRGYDVYDQAAVGFITDGPDAKRLGMLFDTAEPGNSNAGHTYGTALSAAEKRALIEFLKTR